MEAFESNLFQLGVATDQAIYVGLPEAFKTVASIEDEYRRNHALFNMTGALAESGRIQDAAKVAHQVPAKEVYWRILLLSTIAEAQAAAGEIAAARKTVQQIDQLPLKNSVDPQNSLFNKRESLYRLALAYARQGDFQHAKEVANSNDNLRSRVVILRDIARTQAGKGNRSAALITLHDALRLAGRNPASSPMESLVRLQAELGDPDGALEITDQYLQDASTGCIRLLISIAYDEQHQPRKSKTLYQEALKQIREREEDRDSYSYYLEGIAVKQMQAKHLERALEIARMIESELTRDWAFRQIAIELLKQNDTDNALRVAGFIEHSEYQKSETYREMAVILLGTDREQALQYFTKSFNAAQAVPVGGGTDVHILYELGRSQQQAGFAKEAAATFAQARQRAKTYPEESYVAQLLKDVADAQAQSGDPQGALTAARSQSKPLLKAESLLGVVEGLTD